jgi:hypothetical protein
MAEFHSMIESADGKRAVVFETRTDGLFQYSEVLGEAETTAFEEYPDFIPWPRMVHSSGVFGSLEEAERDARGRVKWMSG